MNPTKRKLAYIAAGCALLSVAALVAVVTLKNRVPPGMMDDIRAGLPARAIKDPDERLATYLENRYGSLTEASNRHAVFLDFFELDRIKTLQLLVKHSPPAHRQANVDAMARWVQGYRASLSPEELAELNTRFQTPEGQGKLKRATAQYNAQDVRYRGSTAPVISELLKTLNQSQVSASSPARTPQR